MPGSAHTASARHSKNIATTGCSCAPIALPAPTKGQQASDGSAYQEYALTDKGKRLYTVVVARSDNGESQLFAPGEAHSVLVENSTGAPLQRMAPHTEGGKELLPDDALVRKPG